MANITRYVGFGKESSYNDKTNTLVKYHADIASASLDIPAGRVVPVASGLGKAPSKLVKAFSFPSGDVVHPLDIKTIGFWMYMALGKYKFTDRTSGFNLHEFYGDSNAIPKSFFTQIGKDQFEHVFTGCVVESMTINVADSVVMATVNIVAAEGTRSTIKLEEDLLIPDAYPLAMHEVEVEINEGITNTNISGKVQNLTISISNNASADQGKVLGQLHPKRIVTGERTVDVSYTLFFEDTRELVRYEENRVFELNIMFTSQSNESMKISLPAAYYDSVPTTVSGRDTITQSATVKTLSKYEVLEDGVTVGNSNIFVKLENEEGSY